MRDIQDKTDGSGDILAAEAFNVNLINELQDFVEDAGFTLDPEAGPDTDTDMFAKSVVVHALGSQYFDESGATDAYVLTRSGNLQPMPDYIDGMIVFFNPGNDNTGASTINVDGLGVKDLVAAGGGALTGGEVVADVYCAARYNSSTDDFELVKSTDTNLAKLDTANTFEGNNTFEGWIAVGSNGGGDSVIAFYADDINDTRSLFWDNSESDWGVQDSAGTTRKLWHAGNDGSGSGLDADTVDGIEGSNIALLDTENTFEETINLNNNKALKGKDTGGTAQFLAAVTSSDEVRLGSGSMPTIIYSNGTLTYNAAVLPTGTFTTVDGKTVTVTDGFITSIV